MVLQLSRCSTFRTCTIFFSKLCAWQWLFHSLYIMTFDPSAIIAAEDFALHCSDWWYFNAGITCALWQPCILGRVAPSSWKSRRTPFDFVFCSPWMTLDNRYCLIDKRTKMNVRSHLQVGEMHLIDDQSLCSPANSPRWKSSCSLWARLCSSSCLCLLDCMPGAPLKANHL